MRMRVSVQGIGYDGQETAEVERRRMLNGPDTISDRKTCRSECRGILRGGLTSSPQGNNDAFIARTTPSSNPSGPGPELRLENIGSSRVRYRPTAGGFDSSPRVPPRYGECDPANHGRPEAVPGIVGVGTSLLLPR